MEQNIRGTGRVHPQRGTNDAAARHVGFDDIGFEIFVQIVADARRPEFDRIEQLFFAQTHE